MCVRWVERHKKKKKTQKKLQNEQCSFKLTVSDCKLFRVWPCHEQKPIINHKHNHKHQDVLGTVQVCSVTSPQKTPCLINLLLSHTLLLQRTLLTCTSMSFLLSCISSVTWILYWELCLLILYHSQSTYSRKKMTGLVASLSLMHMDWIPCLRADDVSPCVLCMVK